MTINISKYLNSKVIIIGIVAGEVSGDILGAGLIQSLKKHLAQVYFYGIGGPRMQSEDMECWYDITELSMMGIIEVALKLPRILNIRKNLVKRFLNIKIDIFIGIDFPDFNITLEKRLKKSGVRIIHYVSPSIWAWRTSRILDLKKITDNVLVLFPFEKLIYDRFEVPCTLVGHTLADQVPLYPNKMVTRKKLGISSKKICLALLPGSRIREIKMLAYDFLVCAKLLSNSIANLEVIVSLHSQQLVDQFAKIAAASSINYRFLNIQKSWELMVAADVSLLTAGTVTLECMLAKCLMVVAYRMNPITFILIKNLIKTPWISLPNLLAGRKLVQEFIQRDCHPKNLAKTLLCLLNYDDNQRITLQKEFCSLHRSIRLNANDRAAHAVLNCIKF